MVSLLAAFGAFAVGFLMRPVGAAFFGHIGDRYGRARALLLSVAMMAIPTVLMGLLPTYATIGVAASLLIVLMRMLQGMAVGGEFTSSIVFLAEHAPPRRRGFFSSWAMFGATAGTMLGSAVGAVLTNVLGDEALAAWGWRAAFVSGIVVAVVGIVLRRNMLDTPAAATGASPVRIAFRDHRPAVLRVFALNIAPAATYYTLFVYAANWVAESTPLSRAVALDLTTVSIVTFLIVAPVAAWASDRFGRRKLLIAGMAGCLLGAWPLVSLMYTGDALAVAAGQMALSACLAIYMASIPAAMCEMFPHDVRVSAVSVGYGLAYAAFGGTAPAVAVWLIATTSDARSFAWYLIALTTVSFAIALTTRDRHAEPLD
jgi:MHS family proline/betaine transporter-like MFS transporter